MKIKLDPRTKLFMIVVMSTISMISVTTPLLWGIKTVMTAIPVLLLILEKRYAGAIGFTALYTVALVLITSLVNQESGGFIQAFITGYIGIVISILPSMITAWYVIKTTKIDEFIAAMQKMHVPDGITISLAVLMRFFPTIKEEYASINSAMKMRGIVFGGGEIGKIVEFRVVPLLFSCVNIGDELSAAAITRGLGGKIKRSSVAETKLGFEDVFLMVLFTIVNAVFLFFKYK